MTRRRFSNRFARLILGAVFAVIAFVIERRVVRAIQKGQLGPAPAEPPSGLAMTSTGDGVEVTPEGSLGSSSSD
jgi:hypothetical protein